MEPDNIPPRALTGYRSGLTTAQMALLLTLFALGGELRDKFTEHYSGTEFVRLRKLDLIQDNDDVTPKGRALCKAVMSVRVESETTWVASL